jgi:hypothetical protein
MVAKNKTQRKNIKSYRREGPRNFEGKPIRITPYLTAEILKSNDTFQTLRENNCQSILLCSTKLLFKIKEERPSR